MKSFGKVAGINLAVVLAYSAVIRLLSTGGSGNDRSMGIVIYSAFAVGFHVAVCLLVMIIMFSSGKRESGRVWLGTAGAVLLIGFSVCLGNGALG